MEAAAKIQCEIDVGTIFGDRWGRCWRMFMKRLKNHPEDRRVSHDVNGYDLAMSLRRARRQAIVLHKSGDR